jgi:hypothetical protein
VRRPKGVVVKGEPVETSGIGGVGGR